MLPVLVRPNSVCRFVVDVVEVVDDVDMLTILEILPLLTPPSPKDATVDDVIFSPSLLGTKFVDDGGKTKFSEAKVKTVGGDGVCELKNEVILRCFCLHLEFLIFTELFTFS